DEPLLVDAVGQGAGDRLGQRRRADAAEQQQAERERRRRHHLALAPAELDREDLAGDDGDGEDDDGKLEVAEEVRAVGEHQAGEDAEARRDDRPDVELGDALAADFGERDGHGGTGVGWKTEGAPQRDALGGSLISPTYGRRRAPAREAQASWRPLRGDRGEPSLPGSS